MLHFFNLLNNSTEYFFKIWIVSDCNTSMEVVHRITIANYDYRDSLNSRCTFYWHIDHEWILNSWWLVSTIHSSITICTFIWFISLHSSLSVSWMYVTTIPVYVCLILLLSIDEYDSNQKWKWILIELSWM